MSKIKLIFPNTVSFIGLLLDFSSYLSGGMETLVVSALGDVYCKCEQTGKFMLAESLSNLCRNINRKSPKTPTAKICIGKLLAILNTNEGAMFDLSKMAKDVAVSLRNAQAVISDVSQVCFLFLVSRE